MKKRLSLLVLFLITFLCVQAKKIEGTIVLNNNEIRNVTFLIPFGFLSAEPNYQKLQTRVRYLDPSNRKTVLRPDDAKAISFTFNGQKIRMLAVNDDLQLSSLFSSQTKVFLKLEIDGKVKLFTSYFTQNSPGMYNASMGMTTGGYTYNVEKFILQKDDSQLFKPRGITFRKDMSEFLHDCPEVVEKIQKKDFRRGDLELIVQDYNNKCSE